MEHLDLFLSGGRAVNLESYLKIDSPQYFRLPKNRITAYHIEEMLRIAAHGTRIRISAGNRHGTDNLEYVQST